MPVSGYVSAAKSAKCGRYHADFSSIDIPTDPAHISPICILPSYLCALTAYDTFLFSVACWSTLQLSWTIVLLASQYWQVARQLTTFEVSNLGRYGFMGGRGGASLGSQMGHQHNQHQGMPGGDGAATPTGHNHKHSHGACGGCGSGFLMNLLGFDRFTKGKAADGLARAGKAPNPFDLGIFGNCKDFWTKGRELGVEYERLYDVPPDGFKEAKRRRQSEEGEEMHGEGRKSVRKSLLMGFGLSRGGSSRAGYEPLNQV
ncbi:uncharacterized protein B0H18DRAFT_211342 [Fomitopsis serialis]|uniref:uncharacterized protein n=1 Tax=Fomitopsis serialis TaxID=139415 RepID=UPI002007EAB3|nr:uncharacterized protein B0H18DRAFT_211342 [Neoantrodia serialis]KAH9929439.1 hypothetical protein B0H18DRAFT_211342 [Neoantrodia serialis]